MSGINMLGNKTDSHRETAPPYPSAAQPDSALSVEDARRRIAGEIDSVTESEAVHIRDALERVLAQDILAPFDVPPHTNSAMDGYAIASIDSHPEISSEFNIIGSSWAGRPYKGAIRPGEAVQIMTGAVMPSGADTVLMQEHVRADADTIRLNPEYVSIYTKGRNVRAAGEDLAEGALVLRAGRRIAPADLGLLASLGIAEVRVKRRLRVAFFCTGDELRSLGEPLEEGTIYDSNRYTLYGMLSRPSVEIHDLGVVADRPEAIRQVFTESSANSDMVISTGGVSVGEADHVKTVLQELGQVHFWKIAMKPGHPLAFGRIGPARFFGLPGNPVAVMVSFYQFVQFALARMAGETGPRSAPTQRVTCLSQLSKRPGRMEFVRGVLKTDPTGKPTVQKTGNQGSGILHSMSLANCFIILPEEQVSVAPGDLVEVQAFGGCFERL